MSAETELTRERLYRIEHAICELADELHGISSPAQIAARGKPYLASLLEDFRNGELNHDDN